MPTYKKLKKFRSSFRYKLFSSFTILTTLLSILLGTLYVTNGIRETQTRAADQLQLLTQQLVYSVRLPLYAENLDLLNQLAKQAATAPHVHSVVITSADGKRLVETYPATVRSRTETISETAEVFSDPLAPSVEDALVGAKPSPPTLLGTVRIERETSDLAIQIRRLIFSALGFSLLFWLSVSCLSYLILRRVTNSYNELIKGIGAMQNGNYSSRIKISSYDEPGRAAEAINQLADSLSQKDQENYRLHLNLLNINQSLEVEITDRTSAEQALRESEQDLKTLLEVMPIGVAWTDLDGKIEFLNNFFIERFGYNIDEIQTSEDWLSCAYPDSEYRNQIRELKTAVLAAGQKDSGYTPIYESRVTCRNGSVRQVITKLTVTSKRKIMTLIDITDREVLQEQIIKNQKLESIGILAGGVAHNFNNALTGVLGFVSLAMTNLDESHKSHKLLQHAEKATKRATGMAKELLTFARGGTPFKKPVSLFKLAEESAALAQNFHNISTLIKIPETVQAVLADEDQLSQVFNNIVLNSIQAMPDGGTLTISAENTMLALDPAKPDQKIAYVRLEFTDQGCGIPSAELNKIFDPYYTTNPAKTGLGLASVHSITIRHGGQIFVDSKVGQGTTLTILLPSTGMPPTSADNALNSFIQIKPDQHKG